MKVSHGGNVKVSHGGNVVKVSHGGNVVKVSHGGNVVKVSHGGNVVKVFAVLMVASCLSASRLYIYNVFYMLSVSDGALVLGDPVSPKL